MKELSSAVAAFTKHSLRWTLVSALCIATAQAAFAVPNKSKSASTHATLADIDRMADQWRKIPAAIPGQPGKTFTPATGVDGSVWRAMGPSGYRSGGGGIPDRTALDDDKTIFNGRINTIAV